MSWDSKLTYDVKRCEPKNCVVENHNGIFFLTKCHNSPVEKQFIYRAIYFNLVHMLIKMCLGGRIRSSSVSEYTKNPIVLSPKRCTSTSWTLRTRVCCQWITTKVLDSSNHNFRSAWNGLNTNLKIISQCSTIYHLWNGLFWDFANKNWMKTRKKVRCTFHMLNNTSSTSRNCSFGFHSFRS